MAMTFDQAGHQRHTRAVDGFGSRFGADLTLTARDFRDAIADNERLP
jgi:hypothetical protein